MIGCSACIYQLLFYRSVVDVKRMALGGLLAVALHRCIDRFFSEGLRSKINWPSFTQRAKIKF